VTRIENIGTFEMLWDCGYCATKGLLGVTHRCCPACGAPQDPAKRYFPPEGQERALENHTFDGVDWQCGGCQTPNGALASFCRNCGAPKDGNAEVKRVGVAQPKPVEARPPRTALKAALIGAVVVVLVGLGVTMLWKKDVEARVTAHHWSRSWDIERLSPQRDDTWCDQMPLGAYNVSRHQEVRSHREVPDGETCSTRNVDQGDGSFRKERECSPRYRSEPIYDLRCAFTIDRWVLDRSVEKRGEGASPAPSWPVMPPLRIGNTIGSERPGARHEKYTLDLAGGGGKTWSCDVDEARFAALPDGAVRTMKVRVVTGGAVCDSL
jgi:hypothetical protein